MDKNDLSQFYSPFHLGGSGGCGGAAASLLVATNATGISTTSVPEYVQNCSTSVITSVNETSPQQNVNPDERYPDFSQIPTVRGFFVFLFVTECFIGVVGNLLVCLTVYRNKSMHSPVNYYIVNLGVCDFLVGSFVLPMKLFELIADAKTNMMNDFWCTILRFLESVVVFASVFTLVAICIERYYAVVYPVHSRINMTDRRIRRVILVVWFIPIVCALPSLYPAKSDTLILHSEYGEISRTICFDQFSADFRFGYFLFLFCFMYLLPLVFIASTCLSITRALMQKIPVHPNRDPRAISLERGRRKVAKMVLVVVFAFMFCWSPYFIITAITQVYNFFDKGQFFFTMLIINLLAFTHSCINPIVYFSMSARFRKGLMCMMDSVMLCMGRSRFSPENSSSTLRRTSHRQLHYPQTSYTEVFHCNNGNILQRNSARSHHLHHHSSTHSHPCRHHSFNHHHQNQVLVGAATAGYSGGNGANIGPGSGSSTSPSGVDGGSCQNFRLLNPSISDSVGKSSNHSRRYSSRYSNYSSSSGHDSADVYRRPVLLQYNSSRQPECCNELIPLQERKRRAPTNFIGLST